MKLEAWELFDLRMRRQNKEPSKAKESKFYGNPAQFVEFESERKRRSEGKRNRDKQKGE